ncbi:hypothetical protein TPHA_0A05690 [Tetrapisispora phaffii CBS 4417]|uniref:WW domain-containing protein n=1 Tax=Tetrapisispora phaffii (strain ATCC 24235 / CBS 4417 / NBRC 1672 / NRRL Y-8282 / UCD 70-5) TaxID=1071381 RepID=G8BP15_TETPH|nr:hypothetical protein TPHA_0A05690 [Tetrapisispora phaffii CBS 4417]CCE61643.1 hypothetical protein TPHA_0A05690 [Tetrapisispora phaffii CBS 4417]
MKIRVWKEFIAPNGQKYYYNLKTKKTTWDEPESLFEGNAVSQGQKDESPVFAFPLFNDWYLVISSLGKKFYFNAVENISVLELHDELNTQLLQSIDKQKLILLVGVARGFIYDEYLQVYEEIMENLDFVKNEISNEYKELQVNVAQESEESADKQDPGDLIATDNGIVNDYYSSSDEEVDIREDKFNEIDLAEDNLQQNDGIRTEVIRTETDFNEENLNSVETLDFNASKEKYFQLFEKYQLNSFSTWSNQSKVVMDDPDFYLITDNSLREDIFEEWCSRKHSHHNSITSVDKDDQTDSSGAHSSAEDNLDDNVADQNEEEENLEPTKYHYLSHIISKANISPDTIFQDIKKDNKKLFKQFKINKFITSKRDLESFSSKLIFYYKKFDQSQRRDIFEGILEQNKTAINKHVVEHSDKVLETLNTSVNEDFEKETQLLKLEDILGLSGSLEKLANDPKYYILGIKDKLECLKNYLRNLT